MTEQTFEGKEHMDHNDLIDRLDRHEEARRELARAARSAGAVSLAGAGAAAHGYLLAASLRTLCPEGAALVVAPTNDAAERLQPEVAVWSRRPAVLLPASDLYLPGPDPVAPARMDVLNRLDAGEALIVVASLPAILQRTHRTVDRLTLSKGEASDLSAVAGRLGQMGYERVPLVERPGQFSVRGGILDVFPSTEELPVRADFFGDEIESLKAFDPDTQRSGAARDSVTLLPSEEGASNDTPGEATVLDFLPEGCASVIVEVNAVQALSLIHI